MFARRLASRAGRSALPAPALLVRSLFLAFVAFGSEVLHGLLLSQPAHQPRPPPLGWLFFEVAGASPARACRSPLGSFVLWSIPVASGSFDSAKGLDGLFLFLSVCISCFSNRIAFCSKGCNICYKYFLARGFSVLPPLHGRLQQSSFYKHLRGSRKKRSSELCTWVKFRLLL
jgi:hypothetical protein